MKIGSIVIHCFEFDAMVSFWQSALGYALRDSGSDEWMVLRDPGGQGPNLSFQRRQRRHGSRNWMHLDLYTTEQGAEVARLEKLGGRRYPWRYREGADFVVMEDPDGNLFCVVQKQSL